MAHSVTCAYGDNLWGKTTFLGSVLHHGLKQNPNFRARLYTCENYDALEPWIKAGILELWVIDTRENPFDTVHQAVQGHFPEDPEDPTSRVRPPTAKDLQEISVWLYEGMATFCDFMMGGYAKGGLAARSGRNERIGPAEETICFTDGDPRTGVKVGGNPRTHYNIVQRWMHGAVRTSRQLPGHVIWTSHEVVAKDERTNRPILGPELTGTAATSTCCRWFGNTIHVMRVDSKSKGKDKENSLTSEYRLYLKPHYSVDSPNIPYKAVLRVPAEVPQEEVEKLIPEYILNSRDSYSELMDIRVKVDALSEKLIAEIKKGTK